jgi:glycosyltransferase involved in cell wall biosynthesis
MTARPFAAIIVPTHNHERFMVDALDSILAQTDPSWEAIVVNDGSTDGSPAIIDAYAAKDSRIIAVHKPNGCQIGAFAVFEALRATET